MPHIFITLLNIFITCKVLLIYYNVFLIHDVLYTLSRFHYLFPCNKTYHAYLIHYYLFLIHVYVLIPVGRETVMNEITSKMELNPTLQWLYNDLRGILAKHLVKSSALKKKFNFSAFFGGPCVLSAEINPPTCKIAVLWYQIKKKKRKNSILNWHKKSPKFQTLFQQWRVF